MHENHHFLKISTASAIYQNNTFTLTSNQTQSIEHIATSFFDKILIEFTPITLVLDHSPSSKCNICRNIFQAPTRTLYMYHKFSL